MVQICISETRPPVIISSGDSLSCRFKVGVSDSEPLPFQMKLSWPAVDPAKNCSSADKEVFLKG